MSETKVVAVACESSSGLDGNVSPHFGHAPYFVVAELAGAETTSSRLVTPPAHGEGPCTMPEFIRRVGANAVIAGGMGASAAASLAGMGIEVFAGVSGNAGAALRAFAERTLAKGAAACADHGGGEHRCGKH